MSDLEPELPILMDGDRCRCCGYELAECEPCPPSWPESYLSCDNCHAKFSPDGKQLPS